MVEMRGFAFTDKKPGLSLLMMTPEQIWVYLTFDVMHSVWRLLALGLLLQDDKEQGNAFQGYYTSLIFLSTGCNF